MLIYLLAITDPEDRSKFMRLYFHNQGLMYSVAKRILRSDALAEDALQEAFFAIARNIEKVHDPESPQTRGFCVVIARNMALTLLRKQQREIPTDWEDMQTVPAPGDDGLADAMAALPQELRDILLLRYDSGYSTAEIGKLMGLSSAQVRRRITKAKEQLRIALEEETI